MSQSESYDPVFNNKYKQNLILGYQKIHNPTDFIVTNRKRVETTG